MGAWGVKMRRLEAEFPNSYEKPDIGSFSV